MQLLQRLYLWLVGTAEDNWWIGGSHVLLGVVLVAFGYGVLPNVALAVGLATLGIGDILLGLSNLVAPRIDKPDVPRTQGRQRLAMWGMAFVGVGSFTIVVSFFI